MRRETGRVAAEALGLPLELEEGFMERPFGAFEGLVVNEVKDAHGIPHNQPAAPILPPDAEHWPQTLERALATLEPWLLEKRPLLIVSHDGIFRAFAESLHGKWFTSAHGTPYFFEPGQESWEISEIA